MALNRVALVEDANDDTSNGSVSIGSARDVVGISQTVLSDAPVESSFSRGGVSVQLSAAFGQGF
jgi:hypothetical protein